MVTLITVTDTLMVTTDTTSAKDPLNLPLNPPLPLNPVTVITVTDTIMVTLITVTDTLMVIPDTTSAKDPLMPNPHPDTVITDTDTVMDIPTVMVIMVTLMDTIIKYCNFWALKFINLKNL